MKISNPFLIAGYVPGEFFCDRENELNRLLNALSNNRSVVIFSLRKMGKTGLIRHVFNELKQNHGVSTVYLDIMHCQSMSDLINELGRACLTKFDTSGVRYYKKTMKFLSGFRPRISFDPFSGVPVIDFNMQDQAAVESTLDQLLKYLNNTDKKVIIALDEFQQVTFFKESGAEALLRAKFQELPNICFIYSGSRRQLLLSMFHMHSRPFYQSAELLALDRIGSQAYAEFIRRHFEANRTQLDNDACDFILEISSRHTWYTQYLCNRIYSSGYKIIDVKVVETLLSQILEENESVYLNYSQLLPRTQYELCKAIACEKGVKAPTSSGFISKHKLGSASTVQTALKALLEKEMVFEENSSLYVYDIFFSLWLQKGYWGWEAGDVG